MRMPGSKSKDEQLDLLDAIATASTDPVPIDESRIDALDGDEPPRPAVQDAAAVEALAGQSLVVSIERLHEDPDNPRTEFPERRLNELAEDIRQHGILQPIVVHPADASGQHRIIHFGAMRLRAAKRAGLLQVPIAVRIAAADPYAQVAENQKRCPLQPFELARFIQAARKTAIRTRRSPSGLARISPPSPTTSRCSTCRPNWTKSSEPDAARHHERFMS